MKFEIKKINNNLIKFEENHNLDLNEMGLLTILLKLDGAEPFTKAALYKRFGRRKIDNSFKSLQDKKYLVSIVVQNAEKEKHLYYVNSIPFTNNEVEEIIKGVKRKYLVKEVPFNA